MHVEYKPEIRGQVRRAGCCEREPRPGQVWPRAAGSERQTERDVSETHSEALEKKGDRGVWDAPAPIHSDGDPQGAGQVRGTASRTHRHPRVSLTLRD